MSIRRAEMDEAHALARVYIASAEHHAKIDPSAYRSPDPNSVTAHYQELLRDDAAGVFVADGAAGAIVGMVQVRIASAGPEHSMLRPRRIAEVEIAVLAEHRRAGVGRRLLAEAERWATEHDAQAAAVDMLTANIDASRFYEAKGYREFGRLMLKKLR